MFPNQMSQAIIPPDSRAKCAGPHSVLLAEDDPEMRRLVSDALRGAGHRVIEAADGTALLDHLVAIFGEDDADQAVVDLVVTDIRMPGTSGLDVVEALRAKRRAIPVIVMTAFGDNETRLRAQRLGAVFLDKPFRIDVLIQTVRMLLTES